MILYIYHQIKGHTVTIRTGVSFLQQIKTKRYNIKASRLIGYCKGNQQLYLKRTGECFKVANGQIIPLELRDAQQYAKANNIDMYLSEGLSYQAERKTQISAYLTDSARSELRNLSSYWHMSISETIERIIHLTHDVMSGEQPNYSDIPHVQEP